MDKDHIKVKAQVIMKSIEKKHGEKSTAYVLEIHELANRIIDLGNNYEISEILLDELITLQSSNQDIVYAMALHSLADLYRLMERFDEAEPLFIRSIELKRVITGENTINFAVGLHALAKLYNAMERYAEAETLFNRSLDIIREITGENTTEYAIVLSSLAYLYNRMERYAEAEPLLKKSLEIERYITGENTISYATRLYRLAEIYSSMRRFTEAESLFNRSLELQRKTTGEKTTGYIAGLQSLAQIYIFMGRFSEAIPLLNRSLEIQRELSGENTTSYVIGLQYMADMYRRIGKFDKAEQLFKRLLQIEREINGDNTITYAMGEYYLANLYINIGRFDEAETLIKNLIEIERELAGENTITYASGLQSLAGIYSFQERFAEAESLFNRSLEIQKCITSDNTTSYATGLYLLAVLYTRMKRFGEAESLLNKSIEIHREITGEKTTYYSGGLQALADICSKMERYNEAEVLYKRSLDIEREINGKNTTSYADILFCLTQMYVSCKNWNDAIETSCETVSICDSIIKSMHSLSSLSSLNSMKHNFLQVYNLFLSIVISNTKILKDRPEFVSKLLDRKIGELHAFHLRKKLFYENATEKEQEEERDIIEKIKIIQYGGEREFINKLQILKEKLWLLQGSVIERIRDNDINIDSSGTGTFFEPDEVIIEYILFEDFTNEPRKAGYCAIVYKPYEIQNTKLFFLGRSRDINEKISEIRISLLDKNITKQIEDIKKILLEPLMPYISNTKKITICPDGELTKIPFELMLPDNDIRYLTSGKDEQWIGLSRKKNDIDIIVGDPICEAKPIKGKKYETIPEIKEELGYIRTSGFPMKDLRYASVECNKIASKLKSCKLRVVLREAFTKEAFMNLQASRILHISTHGFFFESNKQKIDKLLYTQSFEEYFAQLDDPYERCGLVARKANIIMYNINLKSKVLITGNDIMNKDLRGTELVVLSACNSGLGDVKNGDGVYGLQRAFFLAGAKTLVMSLWSVDDLATCILMNKMYDGIINGERVDKSLKIAKEYIKHATLGDLIKDGWREELKATNLLEIHMETYKPYESTYYWAAFICMGDGGAISGMKGKYLKLA